MNYTKEIDSIIDWLTEEDGGHAVGEGNIKIAINDLIELKEALNIDIISKRFELWNTTNESLIKVCEHRETAEFCMHILANIEADYEIRETTVC